MPGNDVLCVPESVTSPQTVRIVRTSPHITHGCGITWASWVDRHPPNNYFFLRSRALEPVVSGVPTEVKHFLRKAKGEGGFNQGKLESSV